MIIVLTENQLLIQSHNKNPEPSQADSAGRTINVDVLAASVALGLCPCVRMISVNYFHSVLESLCGPPHHTIRFISASQARQSTRGGPAQSIRPQPEPCKRETGCFLVKYGVCVWFVPYIIFEVV